MLIAHDTACRGARCDGQCSTAEPGCPSIEPSEYPLDARTCAVCPSLARDDGGLYADLCDYHAAEDHAHNEADRHRGEVNHGCRIW